MKSSVSLKIATVGCGVLLWYGCSAGPHVSGVFAAQPSTADTPDSTDSILQVKVAKLIEQLGDENYHQRVNARWELEQIGLPAFERLRQAASSHPSAHVARAAKYLIESQNVQWWLETDSLQVRDLLKGYNDIRDVDRETVQQQLAEAGTQDAMLALCRLTRFESSELRSKSAALHLMETACKQRVQATQKQQTADIIMAGRKAKGFAVGNSPNSLNAAVLAKSVSLTLGDSNRTAAQWLNLLMDELASPSNAEPTGKPNSLERWKIFVAAEHALSISTDEGNVQDFDRQRVLAVTLRLYRLLGSWITKTYDRDAALELVRPSLDLIRNEAVAVQDAAIWALDSELPELVPELKTAYADVFDTQPEIGYYLAESYLRLEDKSAAQAAARAASESIERQHAKEVNKRGAMRSPELEQQILESRHARIAGSLAARGLFEWAESEYLLALTFTADSSSETRHRLAEFYWFGGEHEKAAQTLKPLAEAALTQNNMDLPFAPGVFASPAVTLANYYYYSGLAAIDRGENELASDFLSKALQVDGIEDNPDVVIALKRIATREPIASYFQEHFDRMCRESRVQVLQEEVELSLATDRMKRAMTIPRLATACNQLAWLLSKCESNPQEALKLSLRSLELMPNEAVFMDTLARCYFSAGQIDEAVRTQRQAVKRSPHERQMVVQLREFEAAAAAQQ